jgi:hypothetical protein
MWEYCTRSVVIKQTERKKGAEEKRMKDEEMKATKEDGRMAKEASLIGQHDGYSTGVTPRFAARRKEVPSRASFNCSILYIIMLAASLLTIAWDLLSYMQIPPNNNPKLSACYDDVDVIATPQHR